MRLLEMQRKLSAIAEIPKILTSTLATVSQSFNSTELLYVQRKCSYDEDALDYELMEQLDSEDEDENGDETDNEQEEDLVEVQDEDDELVKEFKSKQLKDLMPESDYASEVNYATNELSDEPENDKDREDKEEVGENEDDEQSLSTSHKSVYYIKLPVAGEMGALNISYSDDDAVDDGDENESENDSDFLSTTYTWNLRNVPKLRINDTEGVYDLTLSPQQLETPPQNIADTSKVRVATPTPTPTLEATTTTTTAAAATTAATTQVASAMESQKLLFKLDNLERSWPWADREKIIYKQSTCHLVQRKPLGIVGQRIQLLAKQELLRRDNMPESFPTHS